jgi:hypothetical protein
MVAQKVPVLLLIFNRLETVKKVLNEISIYKPEVLFIASDGARSNRPDETLIVDEVRKYVLDQINWKCEVKTLFRDKNLGCGIAVSTAITWFFNSVEKGIILEDDCLPLPGFFEFCQEMLHYYDDNEKIYEVAGSNLQGGKIRGSGSYYFSNYGGIWGWATWARAWNKYTLEMKSYKEFKQSRRIESIFADVLQQQYWINTFDNVYNLDTWDYQWLYTVWANNGICIVPNSNLIKNIGFTSGGTHMITEPNWYKKLTKSTDIVDFSVIIHPNVVSVNVAADVFQFENSIVTSFAYRIIARIKIFFKR